MNTKPKLRLLVARVLIATTTSSCLQPNAHSAVISTQEALGVERGRISLLLDRPEITAQLQAHGVKPGDARARIAALSDAEIEQLSAGIDQARAGAGGGGELVFLAVVLLLLLPFILVFAAVKVVVESK